MRSHGAVPTAVLVVLTALLVPPSSAQRSERARVDPALAAQLDTSRPQDRLLVFVHAGRADRARSAVEATGLDLVEVFRKVGVAVAVGTPAEVRAVARRPGVTYVEPDRPLELQLTTSHRAIRDEEVVAGFDAVRRFGHDFPIPPTDGSGVTVAVVDTGVDGTHDMFQVDGTSKVVRNLKASCPPEISLCAGETGAAGIVDLTTVTNDSDTGSIGGHGTHVSSTAAGAATTLEDGRELRGVAPGAKIVGISVGATLSVYAASSGLNWILEHHTDPCEGRLDPAACPPIRVVNNSYGAGGEFQPGSVRTAIVNALVDEGVTVVFAAGNGGGDGSANNVTSDAQNPTPGVISVAAYDDADTGSRDNDVATFSSRGERGRPETYPDLAAPGAGITAACRPLLVTCKTDGPDDDLDYGLASGTSMAAPHVAGVVALLVDAFPGLTPGQIEDVLEDTAYQFTNGAAYEADLAPANDDHTTSFDKGHGLVDAAAAIAALYEAAAQDPQACLGDEPLITDAAEDATLFVVDTPLPSEPTLDVREGHLGWDPDTSRATFTISVTDLTEANPPGTTGIYFDFWFSHGGAGYYAFAERSLDSERFGLGRITTTRQGLGPIDGEFDAAADEVRIFIDNDDLAAINANPNVNADLPPFADGTVLSGFSIDSRRYFGAAGRGFIPDADTAAGLCPFTLVGGDPPPPPPPPPPVAVDGTITATSPTHAWSGEPTTNAPGLGCGGFQGLRIDGNACDTERIDVVDPGDGTARTLTVTVTTDDPNLNDFDFRVLAPDGTVVATSANGGTTDETVTVPLATYGVYTVVVTSHFAVQASFDATATMQAA